MWDSLFGDIPRCCLISFPIVTVLVVDADVVEVPS